MRSQKRNSVYTVEQVRCEACNRSWKLDRAVPLSALPTIKCKFCEGPVTIYAGRWL